MKPLNLDNRPCSPISSNCVIWQGPDIPCIKLCAGDTVSDVVASLGTELCTLLDQLNVTTFDLSCLNLTGCAPKDIHGLIQLLIDKICELNGVSTGSANRSPVSSGFPDLVVTVAPCFVVGDQTTMQLVDYVQMAANKICAIIDEITLIKNQITLIDARVTTLENTPAPTFTLPSISTGCLAAYIPLTPASATIDLILDALVNDGTIGYCALIGATGMPTDLLAAVAVQCIDSTDMSLAYPGVNMGTQYFGTWVNTPITVADAITNLWLSVCDIYNYLMNTPSTAVVGSTWIDVTSSTVGTLTTYTVSEIEKPGLSVYMVPVSFNKVTPDMTNGVLCTLNGPTAYTAVMNLTDYDDFGGAYNAGTGVFTVPTTGVYSISFFVHLTKTGADGWYDSLVPGMMTAGIVGGPATCNFYCVNSATPTVITKYLSINGSMTGQLTAGTTLSVRVLNLTNFNYTTEPGDIVRFTVQRIK